MKKRMRLLAILLASVLLTGGCGTAVYELTEEEETLIIQYSAYALAKHNIYQKDGMTNALPVQEETQQDQQNTQQVKNEADNTNSTGGNDNSNPEVNPAGGTISPAGAVGHENDLEIFYEGYSLKNIYQEGDYFSVNANEGRTLLIMEFQIKNPGKKTVNLDTVMMKNDFTVRLNGGTGISEKISFGASSLSSYDGEIKAGESQKAVLIFEVDKKTAESIETVDLSVNLQNKIYSVEL